MKPAALKIAQKALHTFAAAFLLAGLILASPARAQNAPTLEGAPAVDKGIVEASRLLGTSFKKESDGYKMTLPAGARVIESQGVDILSFVVNEKRWGGSLQQLPRSAATTVQEMMDSTVADLKKDKLFNGVTTVESKVMEFQNYKAGKLTVSMQATVGGQATALSRQLGAADGRRSEVLNLLRQQFMIQIKDRLYMVLTLYSPLADKDAATRTFDLMIKEFELFDPAAIKERRAKSIQLGKEWLAKRTGEDFRDKMLAEPQLFRVLIGDADVGYLSFHEASQVPGARGGMVDVERETRKGVILTVQLRSFPAEGVVFGENEAFLAFSKNQRGQLLGHYSSWVNVSKSKIRMAAAPVRGAPARGAPAFEIVEPWLQETGVLTLEGAPKPGDEGKVVDLPFRMIVNLDGDKSQRIDTRTNLNILLPKEVANTVQPDPLPKIFEYTWTRFVDLAQPSEMSFLIFNSTTKRLALRNLVVTGKRETLMIGGRAVNCFKCIDEIDPNSTTLWVDDKGRIQMMRTSDQSLMIPTTESEMQTKWGKRLKEQ